MIGSSLRYLDKILAVSRVTADRFRSWSQVRNIEIVPNCIRLENFGVGPKDHELIQRYRIHDRFVIMTFGRLAGQDRAKGFDEVLDVLPALVNELPSIVYLICGDGPDRQRLESKARSLGVHERVIFTGYIQEENKVKHYRLADVFAMPSRGEGFGIVLLEAMACGIPVIGSTRDGTREALLEGALGSLVDPDRPDELIAAILRAKSAARKVPDGLDTFSFNAFAKRLQDTLGFGKQ